MATQARVNGTSAVRDVILQYLQPSEGHDLGIAIPVTLPKESRGMEHNATARFLIPRKHLDAFEADPAG